MMSLDFITLLKLCIDKVKSRTDRIMLPFSLQIKGGSITNAVFTIHFLYKQLESGFSRQNCLYFSRFLRVKLLSSCFVVDQVNYVCEECYNFQDSKLIFLISDLKISPIMLLRQLNFGVLSVELLFYVYYKKLHFSLSVIFILT